MDKKIILDILREKLNAEKEYELNEAFLPFEQEVSLC